MSASESVVVVARWQTTTASLGDVVAFATELRERSLAEPGCLGYDVLQSVTDSCTLVLIERYRDAEALEAHRTSAHYRELVVARILPLLTTRHVDLLEARDST